MGIFINNEEVAGFYINGEEVAGVYLNGELAFMMDSGGGTVTTRGTRNNRSRQLTMSATIADADSITAINSVTFEIVTLAMVVRFTHTIYSVGTTLPANSVTVTATNIPNNFRAGARNILRVTINYTNSDGTQEETGQSTFITQ